MLQVLVFLLVSSAYSLVVNDLRVDYMINPLGVSGSPRFSWVLFDPAYSRGLKQASYNIKVWTSTGVPVWDSGVVRIR